PRVRERPFLDGLHPAAVHADRDLVFGLAGDRARVAADAFAEIDREPVVGHAGLANISRGSFTTDREAQRSDRRRAAGDVTARPENPDSADSIAARRTS